MTTWRRILKPDGRRVVATALMLALLAAAYIQSFAFVDDVPGATKPPLYDALLPFDFWVPGIMLILPLTLLSTLLGLLGISILSSPMIWPLQIAYVYVLASLLVFGHDHWAKDIAPRWRRLAVVVPVLIAIVLWAPGILSALRSLPHMIPFFLSSTLLSGCVLALYAYVTLCAGLALRKRRGANRAGK